jgi:hypothetical protein
VGVFGLHLLDQGEGAAHPVAKIGTGLPKAPVPPLIGKLENNVIDNELKALAVQALVNAFWEDYSNLVISYTEAAKGLDEQTLLAQMQDRSSVFGIDKDESGDGQYPNIWTRVKKSGGPLDFMRTETGHDTILEALEHEDAESVFVRGDEVFLRDENGEWFYLG